MPVLNVMSFNIRVAVPDAALDDPDRWEPRLVAATALLQDKRPDAVGLQEVLWPQLQELLRALPEYGCVGAGRGGGSIDEHSPILYRRDRFDVAGWDQWWHSPTPQLIGSMVDGAGCPRIATLVDLVDRECGARVRVINTHLDHVSEAARVLGAGLIRDRVGAGRDRVAVVTGDFNCAAGSAPAWKLLTEAGLQDTWLSAVERGVEVDTFHDYGEPGVAGGQDADGPGAGERIDWILVTSGVQVDRAEIITDRPGGVWPSDHWPVAATIRV